MQTSKKKANTNSNDPDRIAKIAEIISLLEEVQKTKDWIFQQIKRKHLKLPIKRTMNRHERW